MPSLDLSLSYTDTKSSSTTQTPSPDLQWPTTLTQCLDLQLPTKLTQFWSTNAHDTDTNSDFIYKGHVLPSQICKRCLLSGKGTGRTLCKLCERYRDLDYCEKACTRGFVIVLYLSIICTFVSYSCTHTLVPVHQLGLHSLCISWACIDCASAGLAESVHQLGLHSLCISWACTDPLSVSPRHDTCLIYPLGLTPALSLCQRGISHTLCVG